MSIPAKQEESAFDPQTLWSFGDRIRKARRNPLKGDRMGQKEFAAAIGVGTQVLSNWEAGISMPRNEVKVAQGVAEMTGYPLWWLLGVELADFSRRRAIAGLFELPLEANMQLELALGHSPPKFNVVPE